MTLRPVEIIEGWEILLHDVMGPPQKLPAGMVVKATTKEGANDSMLMVAEQLGSLGMAVDIEEAR